MRSLKPSARTGSSRTGASPYHHGDLPRALVRTALRLVARKGSGELTLREVARAVGVSHTAAYRHFADKRALLAAVAEQGFGTLARRLERSLSAVPCDDCVERVVCLGLTYVRFALEHPSHFEVMSGPRLNEDGRFPALELPIDRSFQIVVREMTNGVAAGVLRPGAERDGAVGLWAMAHGIATLVTTRRLRVKSTATAVTYARSLLLPFVRGLQLPG